MITLILNYISFCLGCIPNSEKTKILTIALSALEEGIL